MVSSRASPLVSGNDEAMKTRSAGSCCSAVSAAAPASAVRTRKPSASSVSRTRSQVSGSLSTTRARRSKVIAKSDSRSWRATRRGRRRATLAGCRGAALQDLRQARRECGTRQQFVAARLGRRGPHVFPHVGDVAKDRRGPQVGILLDPADRLEGATRLGLEIYDHQSGTARPGERRRVLRGAGEDQIDLKAPGGLPETGRQRSDRPPPPPHQPRPQPPPPELIGLGENLRDLRGAQPMRGL